MSMTLKSIFVLVHLEEVLGNHSKFHVYCLCSWYAMAEKIPASVVLSVLVYCRLRGWSKTFIIVRLVITARAYLHF